MQNPGLDKPPDEPKRGRGRPPVSPSEALLSGNIRFTAAQWAKIELYGRAWVRDLVDKGKPPKGWTPPPK